MNTPTDREKLEKLKEGLRIRKKVYESVENAMDESNRILGPRNDIEHQKMKNEIKESNNEK